MNQALLKFLKTLTDIHRSLEWNGWQRRICPSGSRTAYQACYQGCVIKLTNFDCTGVRFYAMPRDERWIRRLKEKDTKWIEIEADDLVTRFGRRKLLQRTIFLPGSQQYEEIEQLFNSIRSVGRLFTIRDEDRLPEEQALLGFIAQMRK